MIVNGLALIPDYIVKGSEIVTHLRFPLVLPYIQLELQSLGLLSELDLDSLFN